MASGTESRVKWTLAIARPANTAVTNQPTFQETFDKIGVFATKFELEVLLDNPSVNRSKTTIYVMRGDNTEPVWENEANFIGGSIEILAQLKPPSAVLRTLANSFVFEGRLDLDKSGGVADGGVAKQPRVNGFHVKPYQRENLTGVRVVIWINDVRSAMYEDMEKMPLATSLKQLFVAEFGKGYDAVQFTPHFNRSAYDLDVITKRGFKDELVRVQAEYGGAGFKVNRREAGERKLPRGVGDDAEDRKKSSAGRGESRKADHSASMIVSPPAVNGYASNGVGNATGELPPVETKCYGKHNGKSLINNAPIAGVGHGGQAKPAASGESNFGFNERGRFDPPPSSQHSRPHGREDPAEWNAPHPRVGGMGGGNHSNNGMTTKRGEDWATNNNKPITDAELLGDLKATRGNNPITAANPVVNPRPASDGGGAFGFASITPTKSTAEESSIGSATLGAGRGKPQITPASSPRAAGRGTSVGGSGGAGRGSVSVAHTIEKASPVVSNGIGGSVGGGRGKPVAS